MQCAVSPDPECNPWYFCADHNRLPFSIGVPHLRINSIHL